MRVLVTGRSGSGKSTICRELIAQGYPAFDGDQVPGLAAWVDTDTGQTVEMDYSQPIDRQRYKWQWSTATLQQFLKSHATVFLCGSADNDLTFFPSFDYVFALDLPADIQRARILARSEHDYGKQPGMAEQILTEQQAFIKAAKHAGATTIDATASPATIIHTILEHLR